MVRSFLFLALLVCSQLSAADVKAGDFLSVTAVGDILMGTTYPVEALPPDDGEGMFDAVKPMIARSDIVLGNLEGPLIDGGKAAKCGKEAPARERCFEFRMPARYARHLRDAGFNLINIANNHSLDFGIEGLRSTVTLLEEAGIQPLGGERIGSFVIRGKRVAAVGFSFSPISLYSHSLRDTPRAGRIVRELKARNDLVIVSFHGGAEGSDALGVTDAEETYAGAKRGNVVRFSRAVIDAGADLVLGHGPHVPRALELYRKKLIAFSLGNFLTYGPFNLRGPSGLSYLLKVNLEMGTGNFAGARVIPLELFSRRGIPFPDPAKRALALIRKLTEQNGNGGMLNFDDDGNLR
jgi:hypothetical protein